jgi:hypothetical protein
MITRSVAARKRRSDLVAEDPTNTTVSGYPPKLSVRILRFHAVAAWSWNANDDVCGICQAAFEGVCPGVKYPGEDCPVVWYVVWSTQEFSRFGVALDGFLFFKRCNHHLLMFSI